jgi:hypothetical protein
VKDLFKEEFKSLKKEIEEDHRKMESSLMVMGNQYCENGYITKTIYTLNEIPIKYPMTFITKIEKSTLKHQRL